MKIGVVSDLHLNHYKHQIKDIVVNIHQQTKDCDLMINAGDTSEYKQIRDFFTLNSCDCELVEVMGNHDYYYDNPGRTLETVTINGIKIVLATLWTNFNDDYVAEGFASCNIADFIYIKDFTTSKAREYYDESIKYIEQHSPDILVTHFAVHPLSIDPKFKNDQFSLMLNSYFVNNLDNLIVKIKPKLIVHGHCHSSFDYYIDDTRIICNPLGYPYEIFKSPFDYRVKIIEI